MKSKVALPWCQDGDNLLLNLVVQPRSSRNRFCGIHAGELKLQLTSPPVDGAANECCREFIAKQFRLPKSAITLLSGQTSRHKRVRISGLTTEQIEKIITSDNTNT